MGNCLKANSSVKLDSTISTSVGSEMTISTFRGGSSSIPAPRRSEGEEILSSSNLKSFSYLELKKATRNFRPGTRLGEGGFGYVFKGWIDGGMAIAVKNLSPDPENFRCLNEWMTEVNYLGQLHHPNLVKLIGYCNEGDKRLLVSEFVPKGSLGNHLFRRCRQPLPWATRLKVAIGAAKGLAFLHDAKDQVICLNFKASNILLDAEFNAKLSDFGLVKAGLIGDRTHVSKVMGSHMYPVPELFSTGHFSAETDVYNFGVVLLELLTGRRGFDREKVSPEIDLVKWTKPYLVDKRHLCRIIDAKLEGQYPKKAVYTVATLARQCLSAYPSSRPRMSEVLASLEELQNANNVSKDHRTVTNMAPKLPAGHHQHRLTPLSSPLPTARRLH